VLRGAKLGRPEAPVVAIHGDGGYLMNAQELETAVRHGIGVVTIVMNNNCWDRRRRTRSTSTEGATSAATSAPAL